MSQAENLLNSLTVDDIATYTAEPQEEGHIVIGKDRIIVVPESLKRIAVQHDKNVETVTFDCHRYWDEYDLSKMQICINFLRPDEYKSSYIAQNITVDADDTNIIHFTWTIDSDVTPYKGKLKFLVCAKVTDEETGVEQIHWNSELNDEMFISEGLDCEEHIVEENYAVITQLLARMDAVEAIAVTEADMATHVANATAAVTRAEAAVATATDKAEDMGAIFEKFEVTPPSNNRLYEMTNGTLNPDTGLVKPVSNELTCYSNYIPVTPGEIITVQMNDSFQDDARVIATIYTAAAYDENMTFISGSGVRNVTSYTVPAGASYIICHFDTIYLYGGTDVAIVASETVIPYEEYFGPTYGELKPESVISTTSQLGNAVKRTVFGEAVHIDDVSPAMHNINTWIHGKNLFNGSLLPGLLGSSSFGMDLTDSAVYRTMKIHLPKAGIYTVSFSTPVNIVRLVKDNVYVVISDQIGVSSYTFNIESGCDVGLTFRDTTSTETAWSDSNTVQVEVGATATEYEPYMDPTTVTVSSFGKNLLDISTKGTTETTNGVTVTRVGDQLRLSGTLTSDSNLFNTTFHMCGGIGNTYTLSCEYLGGTVSGGQPSVCVGSKDTADSTSTRQSWLNVVMKGENNSIAGALTRPYIKDLWFYAKAGTVFTDYRIRIQLERGDTTTDHEVSKKATYVPDANGMANILSVSPTMNVLTDTPGTIINCEYNRDMNKVIGDIEVAIDGIIEIQNSLIGGESA